MKKSIRLAQMITLAIVGIVIASHLAFGHVAETCEAKNCVTEQLMPIACEHCHENIIVNIMEDHAVCPHCEHTNEFSG